MPTIIVEKARESVNTKGLNVTLFQISRIFYNYYPQIGDIIYATPSHKFITAPHTILSKLSFSHIREIMTQDDRHRGIEER